MTARAFSKALTVKDLSARTMIKVVKIGGNVVDNPELLREFVKDFAATLILHIHLVKHRTAS